MDMHNHLLNMAKYQKWAYTKLFDKLNAISDLDYYKDYNLFFKSIHGTLNHMLLVDKLWYSRFTQIQFEFKTLNQELVTDRRQLMQNILEQADIWINFVAELNPNNTPSMLYYNKLSGTQVKRDYLSSLSHVFNHGTHHRGQISSIISQLNYPAAETDYIYYLDIIST